MRWSAVIYSNGEVPQQYEVGWGVFGFGSVCLGRVELREVRLGLAMARFPINQCGDVGLRFVGSSGVGSGVF